MPNSAAGILFAPSSLQRYMYDCFYQLANSPGYRQHACNHIIPHFPVLPHDSDLRHSTTSPNCRFVS